MYDMQRQLCRWPVKRLRRSRDLCVALSTFLVCAAIWAPTEAIARNGYRSKFLGTGSMPCRWKTLQSQGFGDPIGEGVKLRFIGTVPGISRRYYLYHWDFVNPVTIHGRQSIIILQYRCTYIGQYSVMAAPSHIVKDTLFFRSPKQFGDRIRFRNGSLPPQAWIDGEVNAFRR
jgi:hypothetical protein